MRSALTTLGVVIGVAAVVTMTSGRPGRAEDGRGSNLVHGVEHDHRSAGQQPRPGGFVNQGAGANISLESADGRAIAERSGGRGGRCRPQYVAAASCRPAAPNWFTPQILGVEKDYFTVRDLSLASGRSFTDDDARKSVLVIGQNRGHQPVRRGDPIGQRIRVGRVPFEVIGVLTPKGQSATWPGSGRP